MKDVYRLILMVVIAVPAVLYGKTIRTAGDNAVCSSVRFENIPVKTGEGIQGPPAIWGNYIVWKGAVNEAYDIEQGKIVEMPGLVIDGTPAIWENKVVWSGSTGYYDLEMQQIVYLDGLTIPEHPAIPAFHNNKIVWDNSNGYYDLELEQMVYPPYLSVGENPDIFNNKIVWDQSGGYYDIDLRTMVSPGGFIINRETAIYGNRMVWRRLDGGYFDLESGAYFGDNPSIGYSPDIFDETVVWHTYNYSPYIPMNVYVWNPICGKRKLSYSNNASGPKIYDGIVVWTDTSNGNADIYMANIPECIAQQIIYVDADGGDDRKDGQSPETALATIQHAINISVDGATVAVLPGVYTGTGNRDIDFLGKAITVSGQAGPRNCIIDCQGSKEDPHNGVHIYCESSDTAILNGFTITNGYFKGYGGGIKCDAGGLVKNCIITNNKAWYGGGISIGDGAVLNCVISNNISFQGTDSLYKTHGGSGGGIHATKGNPYFINCTIVANKALACGGISWGSRGTTTMENCIISDNNPRNFNQPVTSNNGGGVPCGYNPMILVVRKSCIQSDSCDNISEEDCFEYPIASSTLKLEDDIYTTDVRFVDTKGGDFRLLPDSPCIDAGTNETIIDLPVTDIEGNPRIADGNRDGDAIVDLGVYEALAPDQPYILASPSSLVFVKRDDRLTPDQQIVSIYNIGLEQLEWTIQQDCNWLSVSPESGVTGSNFSNIVVSIIDANLAPGVYTCNITITEENALNSPQAIPVTLQISRNLKVPSEFPTIQEAIDSANPYDSVLVADGVYQGPGNEEISFCGKRITVRSENGPEDCIVGSVDGLNRWTFIFEDDEDEFSVLDGFALLAGRAPIKSNQSAPTIRNCFITGDIGIEITLSDGIKVENCIINNCDCGISAYQSSAVISGCMIQQNHFGLDLNPQDIRIENCIISGNGDESPQSGWIATNGWNGLVIKNSTIVGNRWSIWTGYGPYYDINPKEISNCIFWNNRPYEMYPLIENNKIRYCNVKDGWPGEGNIDADPCFANPGYWDPNGTVEDANDDFWVEGDYHLKSQAGRWDAGSQSWVVDREMSPCIDAGDLASPIGHEPFPNGGVVNMGAYGGTVEASKSWFGTPTCGTIVAGDINGDCVVNFKDFVILAMHWQEQPQ